MYYYNKNSLDILERVSKHFGVKLRKFKPIESNYSIGIETEIKFKYYYPQIFEKWFKDKKWKDRSDEEKDIINKEITLEETNSGILKRLQKCEELGIKKGKDCYWEFALDPVTDLSIILTQLYLLKDIGVLPMGQHSLHLTIGGKEKNEESYWILLITEMLFSSKNRLKSGIDSKWNKTYFRKGDAGLLEKRWRLLECDVALEFRSLELLIEDDLSITWNKLNYLNNLLSNESFRKDKINKCRVLFNKIGLPNTNWKKYRDYPTTWDSYYENYENLKKEIL